MQQKAGGGTDIPESVRNGDWIYQAFSPEGKVNEANLTACFQCHLAFAKDDQLSNMARLQGRFPSAARAAPASGPLEVAIANSPSARAC